MDIKFVTPKAISEELRAKLEKEFGFEIELDSDDDGCFEYFFGYSQDNVGTDGCCEEDPLPYDEAVRCCGVLWREGIHAFAIEGNGGWATGMMMTTDFSRYAVDDSTKNEWARTAAIFWGEADPSRVSEITPTPALSIAQPAS